MIMVPWYWSVDTLFWQLSINHNMDIQGLYCSTATCTLLFFQGMELWLTDIRTYLYGQSHDNQDFWDWWVTKFSEVCGSSWAGALLIKAFTLATNDLEEATVPTKIDNTIISEESDFVTGVQRYMYQINNVMFVLQHKWIYTSTSSTCSILLTHCN